MRGPLTLCLIKSTVSVSLKKRCKSHALGERKLQVFSSFSYAHMKTGTMAYCLISFFLQNDRDPIVAVRNCPNLVVKNNTNLFSYLFECQNSKKVSRAVFFLNLGENLFPHFFQFL